MRKAPPLPENLSTVRGKPFWEATFEVELLTRLFGGGVEARKLDPLCWLRPSALKSALRFWWRAAYGPRYPDLERLRRREGELFGSPGRFENGKLKGGPGLVSVEVVETKKPVILPYALPKKDQARDLAFLGAYFPAAPIGKPVGDSLGEPGALARVTVRVESPPEEAQGEPLQEIQTALRLWLVLGGVGSRSRKGAGAIGLQSEEDATALAVPKNPAELEQLLREVCGRGGSAHPGVFLLSRTLQVFCGSSQATAVEAHRTLLEAHREARQDRDHPADWWGEDHWGETRWPEADAVRHHVDPEEQEWAHPPDLANRGKFPRAALGLPIVFHFKPPKDRRKKEPPNRTLSAARRDLSRISRYASPVLLRPVRIWEDGKARAVPLAIFTECTLPADATAILEAKAGVGAGQRPVRRRDLTAYRVTSEAPATLDRVMQPFRVAARGFRTLWPLTGDPDA